MTPLLCVEDEICVPHWFVLQSEEIGRQREQGEKAKEEVFNTHPPPRISHSDLVPSVPLYRGDHQTS